MADPNHLQEETLSLSEKAVALLGEQSVGTVFEEQLSPDIGRKPDYRAPYMEVPRSLIADDWRTFLSQVVPHGYSQGSYTNVGPREPGDVMMRFVELPKDTEERSLRVKEIARLGTDRTDPTIESRYQSIYDRLSRETGIDQMNIFDAMSTIDFAHRASSGHGFVRNGTNSYSGANGVLIYDAKTEKGIHPVPSSNASLAEMTFKDPSRRNEALLRVVYLS